MLIRHKLIPSLVFFLTVAPATAGPIVYVVNLAQQFGVLDLGTGVLQPIGPGTPEGTGGLVPGPDGSLLSLTFSGKLDSIDPASGITTLVGATGLGDCSSAASPCALNSASALGELGGNLYATDFGNNLYGINPANGQATLIGPTGIPGFAFNPNIPNPDGTINIFDATLFSAAGKLYATFDTATLNLDTNVSTPVIAAGLYEIDPSTARATMIAATASNLSAVVAISGTVYAFRADGLPNHVVTLDLTNGQIGSPVSSLFADPGQLVLGASPIPEPSATTLVGIGIVGLGIFFRRVRVC